MERPRTRTCTAVPCGRVPPRVHQQVLDHTLDLAGVDVHEDLGGLDTDRVRLHTRELTCDPTCQLAHVGRCALGLDVSAVQPVEIQQVVDQTIHLLAALLDHVEHRRALFLRQTDLLGAVQRLDRAEDPCERTLEVVGDRVQECVLHLVQLAESGRDLGLAIEVLPLRRDDAAQRAEQHRDGEERGEAEDRVPPGQQIEVGIQQIAPEGRGRGQCDRHGPPAETEVPRHQADRHQIEERDRQARSEEVVHHRDDREERGAEQEGDTRGLAVEEAFGLPQDTALCQVIVRHEESFGGPQHYLESGIPKGFRCFGGRWAAHSASSCSPRARKARPRWLIRSFSSSVSSAIVRSPPPGTKIGS